MLTGRVEIARLINVTMFLYSASSKQAVMDARSDQIELMSRVAQYDQAAFQRLYDQYGTPIYSLAFRILQNTTLAEEVTQDTLLKVWNQKTQWNPDKGELKSWLLTITHFTAIDRLRQERRQPALHPDALEDMEHASSMSKHAAFNHLGWQDEAALRLLIKQLPPEQAQLIQLAFFGGMSHGDIAEETGLPLGTVKTRLRSALQQLRSSWLDPQPVTGAPFVTNAKTSKDNPIVVEQ
jgi:RNA polymerase sigma-70 factor (ECF subfamily)